MGLASHLGPWKLGTVKETTGTTAGKINNMGVTQCIQKKAVAFGDTAASTAFVLPAGATITGVTFLTTAAFSSAATIKLTIGATDITTAGTVTNAGNLSMVCAATTGAALLWANVGTTDAIVTYTVAGTSLTTGLGTVIVNYAVCLPDGTYNPTSQTV